MVAPHRGDGVGAGWIALPRTLGSGYSGVGTETVAMPRTQSGGYDGVGKDGAVKAQRKKKVLDERTE